MKKCVLAFSAPCAGAVNVSDVQPGEMRWSGALEGLEGCLGGRGSPPGGSELLVCVLLLLLMVHALKCPYCPASHLYPAAATTAAAAATAAVRWDDVLTYELRWSRELRYPDRLIVHRKGTPGWQVGWSVGDWLGGVGGGCDCYRC